METNNPPIDEATTNVAVDQPVEEAKAPVAPAAKAQETPAAATPESKESETADSLTTFSEDDAEASDNEGGSDTTVEYEDFELPDGFEMDTAALERFAPLMAKHNLTQEMAQEFVSEFAAMRQAEIQAENESIESTMRELNKANLEAVKADPVFGGDNLEATRAAMSKVLGNPAGRELGQLLALAGLESHPAVIKALAPLGQLMTEDTLELGGDRTAGGDSEPMTDQQIADTLFPTTRKK